MRRLAPRPLTHALAALTRDLQPQTPIARVQSAWRDIATGPLKEEADPVSERAGTVTIACRSSVWAQELSMLETDLKERLNEALGAPPETPAVTALRFIVQSPNRTG